MDAPAIDAVDHGVRPMRADDVAAVSAVGADAGRLFATVADPRIARCADDPPFTEDELLAFVADGLAWVAVEAGAGETGADDLDDEGDGDGDGDGDRDERIVGFLLAERLGDGLHVEELAVARAAGRRGHGGRLLDHVAAWAEAARVPALTLTTFRDVPWNAPWYRRHGFRDLDPSGLPPALAARRADEDAAGLAAELRVVQRRDLRPAVG